MQAKTNLETFIESARSVDVETTVVQPADVRSHLEQLATEPIVATSLPFDGVELPSTAVTDPSRNELEKAVTGITSAAFGICEYGTVAIALGSDRAGPISLFPRRHIAVLDERDLLIDIESGLSRMRSLRESGCDDVIFVTGPSSTSDMGESVQGVHGPERVDVIIIRQ